MLCFMKNKNMRDLEKYWIDQAKKAAKKAAPKDPTSADSSQPAAPPAKVKTKKS